MTTVTVESTPVAARPAAALRRVPACLAVATVLAQIAFPLLDGGAQHVLTMVTVTLFFAASVTHALIWRGAGWTLVLVVVTAGSGLLVESVGVALDVPFGAYRYTDTLRPQVLGVPWVIPLAWTMVAYPALLVARRVTRAPVAGTVLAAAALATWDLFLDPQMVDAGHWVWEGGGPALLGIPLTNYVGWAVTALVVMGLLRALLPPEPGQAATTDDRVPIALYLWTYGGSVLAHAVFLDLPGSALVGGVGMGVVVALYVRAVQRPS